MGFLTSLFGGGKGNAPQYDMNEAKDTFLWQQGQGRYNVNNGMGALSWDPNTNTQNISYSPAMQGVINNLFGGDASAKRAEESVFSNFQNRYTPIFEKQTNNLGDRLKNQGIPVGSEAYNNAMRDLSQNQNDATLNAMNQAVTTGQSQANNSMANNLSIFSAFNPMNGYQPGAGTPSIDLYGNKYAGQQYAYGKDSATATAKANGIWDLAQGGAGSIAGLFSDARIKDNLRPVGQLFNGLTVYSFNFPGDDKTRIGLIAQEVQQVIPEAVSQTEEGLLMVDYALATDYQEKTEEKEEPEGN